MTTVCEKCFTCTTMETFSWPKSTLPYESTTLTTIIWMAKVQRFWPVHTFSHDAIRGWIRGAGEPHPPSSSPPDSCLDREPVTWWPIHIKRSECQVFSSAPIINFVLSHVVSRDLTMSKIINWLAKYRRAEWNVKSQTSKLHKKL